MTYVLRSAVQSGVRNLAVSLFLSGIVCLAAQSAKADTFTFIDGTDILSIQSASGAPTPPCSAESCNLTISAPAGYTFDSYSGLGSLQSNDYFLGIAEPGAAPLPGSHLLSDEISVFPPGAVGGDRQVTFGSDLESQIDSPCVTIITVDCQVTETGGVQFGVTINWKNISTGVVNKSDTIQFVSDVDEANPTPEPPSIGLFLIGLALLAGVAITHRRM
jgi:hypothetical protein